MSSVEVAGVDSFVCASVDVEVSIYSPDAGVGSDLTAAGECETVG